MLQLKYRSFRINFSYNKIINIFVGYLLVLTPI